MSADYDVLPGGLPAGLPVRKISEDEGEADRDADFQDDDARYFTRVTPGLLAKCSPQERPGARETLETFLGYA